MDADSLRNRIQRWKQVPLERIIGQEEEKPKTVTQPGPVAAPAEFESSLFSGQSKIPYSQIRKEKLKEVAAQPLIPAQPFKYSRGQLFRLPISLDIPLSPSPLDDADEPYDWVNIPFDHAIFDTAALHCFVSEELMVESLRKIRRRQEELEFNLQGGGYRRVDVVFHFRTGRRDNEFEDLYAPVLIKPRVEMPKREDVFLIGLHGVIDKIRFEMDVGTDLFLIHEFKK